MQTVKIIPFADGEYDATNGGITAGYTEAILINQGEEIPETDLPVLVLKERNFSFGDDISAFPADPNIGDGLVGPMNGGNKIELEDGTLFKVMDRFETKEQYEHLSV